MRRKWRLTIDRREAGALEQIFSGCESTEMVFHADGGAAESADPPDSGNVSPGTVGALARWDDNRNGRICYKEAKRRRTAPVRRGHPALPLHARRGRRRVVCE